MTSSAPLRAPRTQLSIVMTVDAIEERLREGILASVFPAGERIKESVVAAEYGVARHTVRAACTRLALAGLLVYRENHGWSVPKFDREAYEDVMLLRGALEDRALSELLRRGIQPNDETEAILETMLSIDESVPWPRRLEIDCQLHRSLVDQVGSPRLSKVYADVLLQFRLCRLQSLDWLETISDTRWKDMHLRLVRSLREGNRVHAHECLAEMEATPWRDAATEEADTADSARG